LYLYYKGFFFKMHGFSIIFGGFYWLTDRIFIFAMLVIKEYNTERPHQTHDYSIGALIVISFP